MSANQWGQTQPRRRVEPAGGMCRRRLHSLWGGALLLSIVLRVALAIYYGDDVEAPLPRSDQVSYSTLAERLAGGYGYSFDSPWYPFTAAGTPTSHWSFLYTAFVAAVYTAVGMHPLAARLIQAVLGGFALPWMVFRLTRRLLPQSEALAALSAVAAAFYAYFVLYAALLMTETFFIVFVIWSLESSIRLLRAVRKDEAFPWRASIELGFSLGLAALTRQSILPWAVVLFAALFLGSGAWRRRQGFSRLSRSLGPLLLAGVLILACIAPFTIRNYRVYNRFLLLNSNSGYAMYSAQHPMHGTSFREFDAAPLPDDLHDLNEAEWDRELMRRGIQFVLDQPGRYALLSLSRLRAFFEFWPTPDTSLLHNIGRVASFGLYFPFMIYGAILATRRRLFIAGNWIVALFMVFYTTMHLLTWAMVRYRLPVDAAAMPLVSLGVTDLFQRLQHRPVGAP